MPLCMLCQASLDGDTDSTHFFGRWAFFILRGAFLGLAPPTKIPVGAHGFMYYNFRFVGTQIWNYTIDHLDIIFQKIFNYSRHTFTQTIITSSYDNIIKANYFNFCLNNLFNKHNQSIYIATNNFIFP